jgi:hypothetical protein
MPWQQKSDRAPLTRFIRDGRSEAGKAQCVFTLESTLFRFFRLTLSLQVAVALITRFWEDSGISLMQGGVSTALARGSSCFAFFRFGPFTGR